MFGGLDLLGYIIAEEVCAAVPVPPFPASVKDGYAVIGECIGATHALVHLCSWVDVISFLF